VACLPFIEPNISIHALTSQFDPNSFYCAAPRSDGSPPLPVQFPFHKGGEDGFAFQTLHGLCDRRRGHGARRFRCTPYCINQIWFPNTAGANWTSPVNYADGSMYVRRVIREMQRPCTIGLYYWWNGNRAQHGGGGALDQSFTEVGQEETSSAVLKSLWSSHPVNWSDMGFEWRFQIRDDGESIQFLSKEEQRTYLPLTYNATVVLVPAGETFSGWENYPYEGQPVEAREPSGRAPLAQRPVHISRNGADGFTMGVLLEGPYRLEVVDSKGRAVVKKAGFGPEERAVASRWLPAGVYLVKGTSGFARFAERIATY
jgi:hypothetical protein